MPFVYDTISGQNRRLMRDVHATFFVPLRWTPRDGVCATTWSRAQEPGVLAGGSVFEDIEPGPCHKAPSTALRRALLVDEAPPCRIDNEDAFLCPYKVASGQGDAWSVPSGARGW